MPHSRARVTGVVYLAYFLTAMLAALLASRGFAALGMAVNLFAFADYVAVTLLFYGLFKPVSRNLSMLAAIMSILGCAVGTVEAVHLAPIHLSPLWFFGPYCILLGWLTLRSTFLPRVLGALLVLAGIGWLAYLSPAVASALSRWIMGLGILSEGLLMLWLVARGVDERKWQEQACRNAAIAAPHSKAPPPGLVSD
jgi:uncharacterized protein DUF4386